VKYSTSSYILWETSFSFSGSATSTLPLPLKAMIALSFFEPMTAPEPLWEAEWPWSTKTPAHLTVFSPAGPIERTLAPRPFSPYSSFRVSYVS
jgi:hypothetical protein